MKISASYSEEELLTAREFNHAKFDPSVPVEELDIDKRILDYWRREGLLPFIPKGKWAKVSFMQILWIDLLDAVRSLELPVRRLKDLTDYFITRAYHDELPKKNLEYNRDKLEGKAKLTPLTIEELGILHQIKDRLRSDILLYTDKWDINYFSNLVTESILDQREGGVLIFRDFICEFVGGRYRVFPDREVNLWEPHVHISLGNGLKHFIKNEELTQYERFFDFLPSDEQKILKEVRNRNVKSITITKSKDGEVLRIDSTKAGRLTEEQTDAVKEILGLGNYESITLDTVDRKTISYKRTNKTIKK